MTTQRPYDRLRPTDPTRPEAPVFRVTLAVLMVATTSAGLVGFDLIGPYSSDTAKTVFFGSLCGVVVLLAVGAFGGHDRASEPF